MKMARSVPLDMVTIRRIILGNLESYPDSDAWRFYSLSDDASSITIESMTADEQVSFMGVKIGDVNLDFDPSRSAARSSEVLGLRTADKQMSVGQSYRVDLHASDLSGIEGYQFTLEFAPNLLQVEEVQTGELVNMTADNFGVARMNEGLITTSWHRDGAELDDVLGRAEEDPILFTVVVTALDNVPLERCDEHQRAGDLRRGLRRGAAHLRHCLGVCSIGSGCKLCLVSKPT